MARRALHAGRPVRCTHHAPRGVGPGQLGHVRGRAGAQPCRCDDRRGQCRQAGAELRPLRAGRALAHHLGRRGLGAGGAGAGPDRLGLAGAPLRPGAGLPGLGAHAAAPAAGAHAAPRCGDLARRCARDARCLDRPQPGGRPCADAHARDQEPAVGDPRRGRAAGRPGHAGRHARAFPGQHHARDPAHPGDRGPHDGTDRAGEPARAGAGRPGRPGAAAGGTGREPPARGRRARPAHRAGAAGTSRRAGRPLPVAPRRQQPAGQRAGLRAGGQRHRAGAAGRWPVGARRRLCATGGPASPTTRASRCSRSSTRWRGRTAARRARGWGWPSCARSPSSMGARPRWRTPRAGGALAVLVLPLRR